MIIKEKGSTPDSIKVTFEFPSCIWAESVHLVGDFNDWSPSSLPMTRSAHHGWRVTIELERGKSYQCRYLLDGERWANDPAADGYVANPYGGENSVVNT